MATYTPSEWRARSATSVVELSWQALQRVSRNLFWCTAGIANRCCMSWFTKIVASWVGGHQCVKLSWRPLSLRCDLTRSKLSWRCQYVKLSWRLLFITQQAELALWLVKLSWRLASGPCSESEWEGTITPAVRRNPSDWEGTITPAVRWEHLGVKQQRNSYDRYNPLLLLTHPPCHTVLC